MGHFWLIFMYISTIHATIYVNTTLPDEAFNNSNPNRPQMKLEKLTIARYGNDITFIKITFNLTLQHRLPNTEWDGQWFVNDFAVRSIFLDPEHFAHSTDERWYDGYTLVTYILSTNLPSGQLKNKAFNLRVQFFNSDDLIKRNVQKVMWFYSEFSYDITLLGRNLNFSDHKGSTQYKFDEVQYSIRKYKGVRNYKVFFNFPQPSAASYVSTVSSGFEGLHLNTVKMQYVKASASCDVQCHNNNNIVRMFRKYPPGTKYRKGKGQEANIILSSKTTDDYYGVYTVAVETTNRLNSTVRMTFDVTSYLYDGIDLSPLFFGPRYLFITDLRLTRHNDKALISCRLLGYQYANINFYKVSSQGKRVKINNTYKKYTINQYFVTQVYEFQFDEANRGTYICSAFDEHYPYTDEKTITI